MSVEGRLRSRADGAAGVRRRRRLRLRTHQREAIIGVLFATPAMLGFVLWWLGPIVASAVLSLTNWNIVGPAQWIGLQNYFGNVSPDNPIPGLIHDPLFLTSIRVTVVFALMAVPLNLLAGLAVAAMLNRRPRPVGIFRTIYYLPSMLPAAASALLWLWLYNPTFGLINNLLLALHLPTSQFLLGERSVLPSLAFMNIWNSGTVMVIFLAALQGVPETLYDAATVDGAGVWQRFLNVTVPAISPVILFNFLTTVIAMFSTGVVQGEFMTQGGGPNNASLFYGLYLYRTAFQDGHMGYAMALGWVMFLALAGFSFLVFRLTRSRVYYEDLGLR